MAYKINAIDLAARLSDTSSAVPLLLDVREEWEWNLVHIERSLHIPMNLIPARLHELPENQPIVTICHHGVRSWHVALYLEGIGFKEVASLSGGVEAWASLVDSSMPHY